MVKSLPKHKVPTSVYKARLQFTVSLARTVFCQGMIVLLNPLCILLSGMLHVYKSKVRVAVFEN